VLACPDSVRDSNSRLYARRLTLIAVGFKLWVAPARLERFVPREPPLLLAHQFREDLVPAVDFPFSTCSLLVDHTRHC